MRICERMVTQQFKSLVNLLTDNRLHLKVRTKKTLVSLTSKDNKASPTISDIDVVPLASCIGKKL